MSYIKKSPNLFLGQQELERLTKFLDNDGNKEIIKREAVRFGLVNNQIDNSFANGLISVGTNPVSPSFGFVKQNELFAIDKDALFIKKPFEDNIRIVNDGSWYWIKVSHVYSPIEEGIVSIAPNGTLTGVGTKFTEVLRGRPNFPSKIKFYNSTGNLLEYEVQSVISDTSAIITAATFFTSESNLKYSVVGTFTPGVAPLITEKEPFQYDSCTFSIIQESIPNIPPVYITGKEFFLARVRVIGLNIEIQDKRSEIFELKADYFLKDLFNPIPNPVFGIESVKFEHPTGTRDKNIVTFEWGFKATNWVLDTNTNTITVLGGSGGRFKDPTFFTNGDFDGWRVYRLNGGFSRITQSTKAGSNINLKLDHLNPNDYPFGFELKITPNAEEIEIFYSSAGLDSMDKKVVYPINGGPATGQYVGGRTDLLVYNGNNSYYAVSYRYKTLNHYSEKVFPLDDAVGYLNEYQFDDGGLQIGNVRTPYFPSFTLFYLTLLEAPNSYNNILNTVISGDLLGVNTTGLSNSSPVTQLFVGTSRQYQHYTAGAITLTADMYINLNSLKANLSPLKNGNSFTLHFKQQINLSTFRLRIVQNYLNPTSWTLIKQFTGEDVKFLQDSEQGLKFVCTWNGSSWIIDNVNETALVYRPWRRAIRLTPNVAPGTGPSFTYTAFSGSSFTAPAQLIGACFKVGVQVVCSNGGGSNAVSIGLQIRRNSTPINTASHTIAPGGAFPNTYFNQGYTYYHTWIVISSVTINKGDVIDILHGGAASFTPAFTVSLFEIEVTADAVNF